MQTSNPPSAPMQPSFVSPASPSAARRLPSSLRWVALVAAALALIAVVASTLPAALSAARQRAYPTPAISISSDHPVSLQVGQAARYTVQIRAGRELTYQWTFCDGTTAVGAQVSHSYTQYTSSCDISVTATDPMGQTAAAKTTVSVVPPMPTADFTFNVGSSFLGAADVSFDASQSQGVQLTYTWDYGDGTTADTFSGATPTHTYANPGTYMVTLTVVDVAGQRATSSQQVAIGSTTGSTTGSPLTGAPAGTAPGTSLGGLDLDAYCRSIGDQSASLDGTTGSDWHCVDSQNNHISVNLTSACQWQFGRQDVQTVTNVMNDPNGWYCATR